MATTLQHTTPYIPHPAIAGTRATRAYWFEFASNGDLVDTDCPEHDDGPAASAMADDCKAYLLYARTPEWSPANA